MKSTEITLMNLDVVIERLGDLDAKEKTWIEKETRGLETDAMNFGRARMAVGERLGRIRDMLKPKGVWIRYLDEIGFDRKTADNLVNGFLNAKESGLPDLVLRIASARGLDMMGTDKDRPLGRYSEAVKQLPPPKTQDPAKVNVWLDKVVEFRKENYLKERSSNPSLNGQEMFRFVEGRLKRIRSHKAKAAVFEEHVGMLMTSLGISNRQSFSPIAIPEGMRAKRGRPRKEQEAA